MPNRIIKDSIKTSEEIDRLSWFEEVFFYRLVVSADDYGRYDGRARVLKNTLFPTKDDVTLKTVEGALDALRETGLVHAYKVEGVPILQIVKWEKHQRIRNKTSRYPSEDEADTIDDHLTADCGQMTADCVQVTADCCLNPIQSNQNPNSASTDAAERKRDMEKDADEMFNRLWERYPRKRGKTAVSKSQRLKLLKVGEEALSECLNRFLEDMRGRDIDYVPYGSTFFNSGYKDYLPEIKQDTVDVKVENTPKPDKQDDYEIADGYPPGFIEICKEHGAYWYDVDNVDMRMCLENDEWFPEKMREWMHRNYALQTV